MIPIHHRTSRSAAGRTDPPGAHRAPVHHRPEDLLRLTQDRDRGASGKPARCGRCPVTHCAKKIFITSGSQYTALRFAGDPVLKGTAAVDRDVGRRLRQRPHRDDGRAYTTECIADHSPFRVGPLRTVSDVEEATSALDTLVQHRPADAPARADPAHRVRRQAVRCTPCRSTVRTQTTLCASDSGWFTIPRPRQFAADAGDAGQKRPTHRYGRPAP